MTARDALFREAGKSESAQLVGVSRQIVQLREDMERAARSDARILITGERGVGKADVARCIHALSAHASMNFTVVNCAGVPESLLESELFGHARGSFTGAYRDKPGALELAHGGSVFLNEIGEMTPRLQALLLRFLQTGAVQKVGADDGGRVVHVRVIAATSRDLFDLISRGTFREDLFHLLKMIHLRVPPLRERPDDIPVLVDDYLDTLRYESRCTVTRIDADALNALMLYRWPGNVRQLVKVLEQLAATVRDPVATVEDLPADLRTQPSVSYRLKRDRRRTVADDLYKRLTEEHESFWPVVYSLYMDREITRGTLRALIRLGLKEARGNYRLVARLFNLDARDYKRFLNFLRKHDCQLPFKEFRQ